jgi:Na+-driven multidrug efflux pump
MFIRSFLLQGTFFAAMIVASRELGPYGLAAHNVVCQLWMLSSYLVDGFATAGTVLGARLAGVAAAAAAAGRDPKSVALPSLRSICARLLLLGGAFGCAFAAALFALRDAVAAAFTRDPAVVAALVAPDVWRTLCLAQPLNALVFVYDGLVYAFQDFGYVRELMEVGVGYAFLPSLAWIAAGRRGGATLGAVWKCKVGLNAWRAVGLAARVHLWLLSDAGFDALASRRATSAGTDEGDGDDGDARDEPSRRGSRSRGSTASEVTAPDSPVSHWRRRGRGERGSAGGEDDLEAPLLSPG